MEKRAFSEALFFRFFPGQDQVATNCKTMSPIPSQSDYFELLERYIKDGQGELCDAIKMLIYQSNEELFSKLDFYNDRLFLEPLLFSFFRENKTGISLEQLLFGYLSTEDQQVAISVQTDPWGRIYLPEIGTLTPESPDSAFELHRDKESKQLILQKEGQNIPFVFEAIEYIKGTRIELVSHQHPLLLEYFTKGDSSVVEVEIERIRSLHVDHINRAMELIREIYPEYYNFINRVTRKFIIFHNPEARSFASRSAHGAGFFSAQDFHDEIFFFEDIIHQCGHDIFDSVISDRSTFLAADPTTPMSEFTGSEAHAGRQLEGTFHGLFTQANINIAICRSLESQRFKGKQLHELIGRQSDDMKRFILALDILDHPGIFTDNGKDLHQRFRKIYGEINERWAPLINSLDTSNQPYIFSYEHFAALNPLSLTETTYRNVLQPA